MAGRGAGSSAACARYAGCGGAPPGTVFPEGLVAVQAGGKVTANADVQVTELKAEDHACLTFGESEELFDLTAAFIRDGLAAGLKVVWLSEAGPGLAAGELGSRGGGGAVRRRRRVHQGRAGGGLEGGEMRRGRPGPARRRAWQPRRGRG